MATRIHFVIPAKAGIQAMSRQAPDAVYLLVAGSRSLLFGPNIRQSDCKLQRKMLNSRAVFICGPRIFLPGSLPIPLSELTHGH